MVLLDINPLIYAFRPDAPRHPEYLKWLTQLVNQDAAFGLADIVCSGFLRVATHPRVFTPPSSVEEALEFIEDLRTQPNCVIVSPGERHWQIFSRLCRSVDAKGNTVPDAYLAALATESGSEWLSADRGFARFPGLRWRHPLGGPA